MIVTLLPEPDSPTMPEHLAPPQLERDAVHRAHDAVLGAERHMQVADVEQEVRVVRPLLAHASRTRGSSRAYATSTRALQMTMKMAP